MTIWYSFLSGVSISITVEDPKYDWLSESAGKVWYSHVHIWFRRIRAGICPCPYFGTWSIYLSLKECPGKKVAVWLDIFKTYKSIVWNLTLFLGDCRLKIVMVFLDVSSFSCWSFWPICFCYLCSIPVAFTSFHYLYLQHLERHLKHSCCLSLML